MKLSEHITRAIDFFYIKPFRKIMPLQTFRYAACGGLNLVLGWLIYFIVFNYIVRGYYLDLGFVVMSPHIQALFIQFPITFFTGFWLNRYITFKQSPLRRQTQLFRYLLVVAGSFLMNYLFMKLFVEGMGIRAVIAKIPTDAVVVVYSYLMQKHFTFKGSSKI